MAAGTTLAVSEVVPHHRLLWSIVAMAFAVVIALLAGCSSSDANRSESTDRPLRTTTAPPTTTTQATTTTAKPDPEAEVKAAYLAAMNAYFQSGRHPADDKVHVGEFFSGAALTRVRQVMHHLAAGDLVFAFRRAPRPAIESASMTSGDSASLITCVIDDVRQTNTKTNAVVDGGVESRQSRVTMRRSGTKWRMSGQDDLQVWPDAKGCRS